LGGGKEEEEEESPLTKDLKRQPISLTRVWQVSSRVVLEPWRGRGDEEFNQSTSYSTSRGAASG